MNNKDLTPQIKEDLTGREFKRWKVTGYGGYERRRHFWNVVCKCGKTGRVGEYQLRKKLSKSCGCLGEEIAALTHRTHGESANNTRSPEYRAYLKAKNQCRSPMNKNYARYGARGIEFRFDSFESFLKAAGRRPSKSHVLRRINKKGHYEAGNIQWTTDKSWSQSAGKSQGTQAECSKRTKASGRLSRS